jgi:hypothetical protein
MIERLVKKFITKYDLETWAAFNELLLHTGCVEHGKEASTSIEWEDIY